MSRGQCRGVLIKAFLCGRRPILLLLLTLLDVCDKIKVTEMTDKTVIMRDAQKYLAKGQIDKAIAEWEKLISESPDGNTYNIIGDLYLKKNDRKSAIEIFHKAADFFRNEGFMLKALALYKKVLNINPADVDALNALGQLSEEKGLTTDAIKYYLAAADTLSKEGKKDRLLDIYNRILSLSPSNIPLRTKVAEIFLREGLKTDAAKQYILIAEIHEEKGDFGKAEEYLEKVLDLQPLNKEAALRIGHVHQKAGKPEEALRHMREATVLFHQDADVHLFYAELCLAGGNVDEAKRCLRKIAEKEPGNIKIKRMLGDIYLREGSKDEAWAEYLPVIDEMIMQEKYEDSVELLDNFRDIAPLETGKRLVSLRRQLGQDSLVAAELVRLGDVLRERDLKDDALGCYREAFEITPDDEHLKAVIDELTEKPGVVEQDASLFEEEVAVNVSEGGKTAEEIFMEADIFARYGLLTEAIKLLEGLKLREPRNMELHTRLKSLYAETSEKEFAVTECLILSELYNRSGDRASAEGVLREACEIYPEDPRLAERGIAPREEGASVMAPGGERLKDETGLPPQVDDYEDELAEAEFYTKQGLFQEAGSILERMQGLFPENADIQERLDNLAQAMHQAVTGELNTNETETRIVPNQELFEGAAETGVVPHQGFFEGAMETSPAPGEPAEGGTEHKDAGDEGMKEEASPWPGKEGYEDVTITDQDLVEAQEMPEPVLDDDVLEIFHEFKKGLEKELGDEDSETHYNLGIAYKEMGLTEDAIKEFQAAREDPLRFIPSSTMLGVCYMEQGLYSLAVDVLQKALSGLSEKDEAYWPVKYDLAEAYEKSGNLQEAAAIYTEVYGWNARFRSISEKMARLKTQEAKAAAEEKPKTKKDRVSYL